MGDRLVVGVIKFCRLPWAVGGAWWVVVRGLWCLVVQSMWLVACGG